MSIVHSWIRIGRSAGAAFVADENGAATVDFVVLTASAGIYAAAFIYDTLGAVDDHGQDVADCIDNQSEIVLGDAGSDLSFREKMEAASASCAVFGG